MSERHLTIKSEHELDALEGALSETIWGLSRLIKDVESHNKQYYQEQLDIIKTILKRLKGWE